MKKFLVLMAMLSVFVFGLGTAHAIIGVADNVPGHDVAMPFICEFTGTDVAPVYGGINTLYAIADVKGNNLLEDLGLIPGIIGGIANLIDLIDVGDLVELQSALIVYNVKSVKVYDSVDTWTFRDILSGDACTLVSQMSQAQRAALKTTLPNGKTAYAGYFVYYQAGVKITIAQPNAITNLLVGVMTVAGDILNRFVSWGYLVDLQKGFASGFSGYNGEFGFDLGGAPNYKTFLNEAGFGLLGPIISQVAFNGGPIVFNGAAFNGLPYFATRLYPRYYLHNDPLKNLDTWTWWIFLFGNNDASRLLSGVICNEDEKCVSLNVPVPDELNFVSVAPILPASLHTGFSKAGMGLLRIASGAGLLLAPEEAQWTDYAVSNNPRLCDFMTKHMIVNEAPYPAGADVLNPYVWICNPYQVNQNPANCPLVKVGVNYGSACNTVLGWSWQRAQASTAALSWDVIHTIDRTQCRGLDFVGCNLFGFGLAVAGLNPDQWTAPMSTDGTQDLTICNPNGGRPDCNK